MLSNIAEKHIYHSNNTISLIRKFQLQGFHDMLTKNKFADNSP
jgi:hypothetical protein